MLTSLFTSKLLYLCLAPLIVESKIGLNLGHCLNKKIQTSFFVSQNK